MKTQTDFWKVVNFDGDEIEVLDYVFDHGDGVVRGATGTRFSIVSKGYYKDATSRSNVLEYLDGCFNDDELFKRWGNERTDDTREKCLGRLYKAAKANNEIDSIVFDLSYEHLWPYLREELKLSDKDAYMFTCTGGGRMFNAEYQGNVNPELSTIIREYESKA